MISGLRPRYGAFRPKGRLDVIGWALASVAVMGIMASLVVGSSGPGGASALVLTSLTAPGEKPAATVETPAGEPAEALLDPTQFRRPPPPADGRPRIAVVMRGLGVSQALTAQAIARLPADISLGLNAYGRALQKDADTARAAGHEVFLDVPVEPRGYPANDGGPQALLSTLGATENAARLRWSMGQFTGYPGVVFAASSPVLDSPETVRPLLEGVAKANLAWAHVGVAGFEGAPVSDVDIAIQIDADLTSAGIRAALTRLEGLARQRGSAAGLANATPLSLDVLANWAAGLEARGFVLVPLSSLATAPPPPAETAKAEPAHDDAQVQPTSAKPAASELHGSPVSDGHDKPAHH
jgi:polysaccharide deacetylase 2 family uncharacterized protein YibQ